MLPYWVRADMAGPRPAELADDARETMASCGPFTPAWYLATTLRFWNPVRVLSACVLWTLQAEMPHPRQKGCFTFAPDFCIKKPMRFQ